MTLRDVEAIVKEFKLDEVKTFELDEVSSPFDPGYWAWKLGKEVGFK